MLSFIARPHSLFPRKRKYAQIGSRGAGEPCLRNGSQNFSRKGARKNLRTEVFCVSKTESIPYMGTGCFACLVKCAAQCGHAPSKNCRKVSRKRICVLTGYHVRAYRLLWTAWVGMRSRISCTWVGAPQSITQAHMRFDGIPCTGLRAAVRRLSKRKARHDRGGRYSVHFSRRKAIVCSGDMRTCSMVSRSRTVTVPSCSVSKSTVRQ